MPIKPENRHRYPADWPQVRERILRRAGMRCEHPGCGAAQYDVGCWRRFAGVMQWCEKARGLPNYSAARQWAAELDHAQGEEGPKPIVIVLTIAHMNHDTTDNRDENLAALCQRHHLAHDHALHMANAQATRRAKSCTPDLFA